MHCLLQFAVMFLGLIPWGVPLQNSVSTTSQQEEQASDARKKQEKGLDAIIAFSQTLTQWQIAIIGGSVALLMGTSHRRPAKWQTRLAYLLFLPAWGFMFSSLFEGMSAQQNVLAIFNISTADVFAAKEALSDHISDQLWNMKAGLFFMAAWLLFYLTWWIVTPRKGATDDLHV
jgi:hypothetical protein